jgi:hypothetical protein
VHIFGQQYGSMTEMTLIIIKGVVLNRDELFDLIKDRFPEIAVDIPDKSHEDYEELSNNVLENFRDELGFWVDLNTAGKNPNSLIDFRAARKARNTLDGCSIFEWPDYSKNYELYMFGVVVPLLKSKYTESLILDITDLQPCNPTIPSLFSHKPIKTIVMCKD